MIPGGYFKTSKSYERCAQLHPKLRDEIMQDMLFWAVEYDMPFLITETVSTLEEDQRLNRVSTTHREGRAFDISAKGCTEYHVEEFQKYFNEKYKDVAAVTKDGRSLLVVYHDAGTGDHFHIQIRRLG